MASPTKLESLTDSRRRQLARGPEPIGPARPWRADVARFRWLLLGTLGVAAGACGGRTGGDDTDELGTLGSAGGPAGPFAPKPGDGPGPVTSDPTPAGGPASPFPLEPPVAPPIDARLACAEPVEALGGGWERCANGAIHRAALGECPSVLPRPPEAALATADAGASAQGDAGGESPCSPAGACCSQDSECDAAPHGYCALGQYDGWGTNGRYCHYGCVVDSECGEGMVCLCGDPVGACVPARCATDEECGSALLCTTYTSAPGCGGTELACQTAADSCASDAQCGGGESCSDNGGALDHRTCMGPTCVIGRPFLIDGQERRAPPVERADWCASGDACASGDGAPERPSATREAASGAAREAVRAAVSQGWLEQALMEHASVAAFARFALQLAALGAPPELLDGAASAMRDEIRHARGCFELARRYAERELGPGPLPLAGALDESSLEAILVTTIREGCVGETVAALEAAEALASCEDPSARALLAQIEHDEGEHARLAWRFVQWALGRAPASARRAAQRAFAAELAARPAAAASTPLDPALLRHGLMPASLRVELRRRALELVIEPCQRALFASLEALAEAPAAEAPPARPA